MKAVHTGDTAHDADVMMDVVEKADLLNEQAWDLNRKDPKQALELAEKAHAISANAGYKKGIAYALRTIGACHTWLSNNEEGFTRAFDAAALLKELDDKKEEAQVYYIIGTNFYYLGDYDHALKYYMLCHKANTEGNIALGIADAHNGIGTVYYTIGDNEKALENLLKSLSICEEEGDHIIRQKVLDGLGNTYNNLGEYHKALECMQKGLELKKQYGGNQQVQSFVLDSIGTTYLHLGDHTKALQHFEQSLSIRKEIGFKVGEAATLANIGRVYFKQGDTSLALQYIGQSLQLSKSINSKELVYKASEALAEVYEASGDVARAFEHYKQSQKLKEEVRNEKAAKRSRSLEMQLKMEQVEAEKQLLRRKNKELEAYFKDVTVLSEIGQKIISSLSVEVIISTVYESVNMLMDAPCLGIGVYNEAENILDFPGYIEKGEMQPRSFYSLDDKNRLAVYCFERNEEVFISDYMEEVPKYVGMIKAAIVGELPNSLLYLPLSVKGRRMGVITVQSFEKNAYTQYHLNIVRNLAAYAAIALENAHLYGNMEETVRQRTRELQEQKEELERTYLNTRLLSEIGRQLTSTLEFDAIFLKLHENVNQLMDAACFGVRLYHPDKNQVEYKFEMENGERQEPNWVSMDDHDNYSVWCIRNKTEIFLNDNLTEYSKYVNRIRVVSGDMPHSLIFYPMMIGDRILGVITIQSFQRNAYTKYHLDILKTLAAYTAIALENANLYENLEEKVRERTTQVMQQKEIIEQKNKEITDSINYAKQIQGAILPLRSEMTRLLPDSFCYYLPKDVVSGDFYWIAESEGKVLVAAADCTGHGVPGAFMSMLGSSKLDHAVLERGQTRPSEVLRMLNSGVKSTLKQNEQGSLSRDGMDIALCSIDTKKMLLEFSGANRPLYYIRNGIMCEVPATKSAIGGLTPEDHVFVHEEIELKKGDVIYLFTDGYADQFGGTEGKKFMTRRFKDMLLDISSKPMAEQQQILETTLAAWKKDREQVDDILVIGIKI
jgi:serine phosphatase RsbU (regulator of sigma subunit)/tetratricopeptide (TPR) repeat protein